MTARGKDSRYPLIHNIVKTSHQKQDTNILEFPIIPLNWGFQLDIKPAFQIRYASLLVNVHENLDENNIFSRMRIYYA